MLEGIPLNIIDLGPWGIVAIVVALVMLGLYRRKLVPEKDLLTWQAAYERSEAARQEADKQIGELIRAVAKSNELGETTVTMLQALREQVGQK